MLGTVIQCDFIFKEIVFWNSFNRFLQFNGLSVLVEILWPRLKIHSRIVVSDLNSTLVLFALVELEVDGALSLVRNVGFELVSNHGLGGGLLNFVVVSQFLLNASETANFLRYQAEACSSLSRQMGFLSSSPC